MGVDAGPDGEPWYRIRDELLDIDYFAPATHFRPIQPEEISPISPEVPFSKKRIDVNLGRQELTAYENENVVLFTKISSGIPSAVPEGVVPTKTPTGKFNVQVKMPSKHMGDGNLTSDINAYELPGVPWVTFFAEHGVAFHGTYWHMNFGTVMSHGCVNMRTDEALWLYRWTLPAIHIQDWDKRGYGTQISVH
jgi:lipoprotein-anchoring transpeptidase ErfK/SrfK